MPNLFTFKPSMYSLNKKYFFTIHKGFRHTKICMESKTSIVNTYQLPLTEYILEKNLPSIFKSKCYNDFNLPFNVEVKRTEIGHLFEHIMLEYICQTKISKGEELVSVSGITDWNWKEECFGTFNITIKIGSQDFDVFFDSLQKSIELFQIILNQKLAPHQKDAGLAPLYSSLS